MTAPRLDLLERPEHWPPLDDVGEVFLGRAFQTVGNASMELMLIHSDRLEAVWSEMMPALQRGDLIATAGGQPIPPKHWFGVLGGVMMMSCATNGAEMASGEYDAGPRLRWIGITADSLQRFMAGDVSKPEKPLTTRERNNLLRIVLGLAMDKFQYQPGVRGSAASNISSALKRQGIQLDEDTVRKYLTEASAADLIETA
jgi:hypothetical protein